jgi:hypothetical protein
MIGSLTRYANIFHEYSYIKTDSVIRLVHWLDIQISIMNIHRYTNICIMNIHRYTNIYHEYIHILYINIHITVYTNICHEYSYIKTVFMKDICISSQWTNHLTYICSISDKYRLFGRCVRVTFFKCILITSISNCVLFSWYDEFYNLFDVFCLKCTER